MQQAETCDDAKHFFAQTVEGLLTQVFGEDAGIRVEDVTLVPEREPFYVISDRLMQTAGFRKEWEASDLRHVIARLAGTARTTSRTCAGRTGGRRRERGLW